MLHQQQEFADFSVEKLSADVIIKIFVRLPPEHLVEWIALVNKQFHALIHCNAHKLQSDWLWLNIIKRQHPKDIPYHHSGFFQFKTLQEKRIQQLHLHNKQLKPDELIRLNRFFSMVIERDSLSIAACLQKKSFLNPEIYYERMLDDENLISIAQQKNHQPTLDLFYKEIRKQFSFTDHLSSYHDKSNTGKYIKGKTVLCHALTLWQSFDEIKNLIQQGSSFEEQYTDDKNYPIHIMAAFHHTNEVIQDVLRLYPHQLNAVNKWNQTPFMLACFYANDGMIEYLLQQPGILLTNLSSKKDSEGLSALDIAACAGSVRSIELLLDYNLAQDKPPFTFEDIRKTFYLMLRNNIAHEKIQIVLKKYPDFYTAQRSTGHTVLMSACFNKQIEVVNHLIARMDVNFLAKTNDTAVTPNATALHYAVFANSKEIVALLLDKMTEMRLSTQPEIIAMIKAAYIFALECETSFEILDTFLQHSPSLLQEATANNYTLLEKLIANDKVESLEYYLPQTSNTNLSSRLNNLFLALAISGKRKMMEVFIQHDAVFITYCDANYDTALILAAAHNQIDIIKCLLQHPIKLTLNLQNKTAIHAAASQGHEEAVEILLAHFHAGLSLFNVNKTALARVLQGKLQLIEVMSGKYSYSFFGLKKPGRSLAAHDLRELVFHTESDEEFTKKFTRFKEGYAKFLTGRLKSIYQKLSPYLREKAKIHVVQYYVKRHTT